MNRRVFAVIPAAGLSSRMGEMAKGASKVFFDLQGSTVLGLTIHNFVASGAVSGLCLAVRREERERAEQELAALAPRLERLVVEGGRTRQESVFCALRAVEGRADLAAVHDAARPFCRPELIRRVIASADENGGALLAVPVSSTLKRSVDGSRVGQTVPREQMWLAQTPQVFSLSALLEAYRCAEAEGFEATDDSQIMERLGHRVMLVVGDSLNIKITTPEDLELAVLIATRFLEGQRAVHA